MERPPTPSTPGERPTKRLSESSAYLAEIVGEESLFGTRMASGSVIDLLDICAGYTAAKYSGSRVVTLAFDRVDLSHPILHQDLVRAEGRVVSVGRSSMVVHVRAYRQDLLSRQFELVQESYVTMVAVDEKLRPNPNIPTIIYDDAEEEKRINKILLSRKEANETWQQCQKFVEQSGPHSAVEVEDRINREGKLEFMSIPQTQVNVKRIFFPKNLNYHNTVFGGDILLWMDRVATQCARQFTRNRHVFTKHMQRVFFKQPILITDVVEMNARVVYVGKCTLEVEINVSLERASGEVFESHSGYFTLLSCNEAGWKRPLITGLLLSDDDQASLKSYMQAKERRKLWKKWKVEDRDGEAGGERKGEEEAKFSLDE
jgi:acyl-CoA hydrolase